MSSEYRCWEYLSQVLFSEPPIFQKLKPKFRTLMIDFRGCLEDGMDEDYTADLTISKAKALVEREHNKQKKGE